MLCTPPWPRMMPVTPSLLVVHTCPTSGCHMLRCMINHSGRHMRQFMIHRSPCCPLSTTLYVLPLCTALYDVSDTQQPATATCAWIHTQGGIWRRYGLGNGRCVTWRTLQRPGTAKEGRNRTNKRYSLLKRPSTRPHPQIMHGTPPQTQPTIHVAYS